MAKTIAVPKNLEYHYMDRSDHLGRIHDLFARNATQARAMVYVLHGNGGMGKTQIALKYANEQENNDYFQRAIWINSASKEQLQQSFDSIAVTMGLRKTHQDSVTRVFNNIATTTTEKVLLIYDNLDDPEMIGTINEHVGLWKRSYCVVITTRHSRYNELAHDSSSVESFSPGQAAELMESLLGHPNTADSADSAVGASRPMAAKKRYATRAASQARTADGRCLVEDARPTQGDRPATRPTAQAATPA